MEMAEFLSLNLKVGNMELCVRLVNSRDGDVQTLAKPDLHNFSNYKYPSLVRYHSLRGSNKNLGAFTACNAHFYPPKKMLKLQVKCHWVFISSRCPLLLPQLMETLFR